MRIILTCLFTFFAMAAVADEPRDIISQQIEAFKKDDFAAAFEYASPFIQEQFGNAQTFGVMVQQGYPMVHRPQNYAFRDPVNQNGQIIQDVLIQDQMGKLYELRYALIETPMGLRINGVFFVPASETKI